MILQTLNEFLIREQKNYVAESWLDLNRSFNRYRWVFFLQRIWRLRWNSVKLEYSGICDYPPLLLLEQWGERSADDKMESLATNQEYTIYLVHDKLKIENLYVSVIFITRLIKGAFKKQKCFEFLKQSLPRNMSVFNVFFHILC